MSPDHVRYANSPPPAVRVAPRRGAHQAPPPLDEDVDAATAQRVTPRRGVRQAPPPLDEDVDAAPAKRVAPRRGVRQAPTPLDEDVDAAPAQRVAPRRGVRQAPPPLDEDVNTAPAQRVAPRRGVRQAPPPLDEDVNDPPAQQVALRRGARQAPQPFDEDVDILSPQRVAPRCSARQALPPFDEDVDILPPPRVAPRSGARQAPLSRVDDADLIRTMDSIYEREYCGDEYTNEWETASNEINNENNVHMYNVRERNMCNIDQIDRFANTLGNKLIAFQQNSFNSSSSNRTPGQKLPSFDGDPLEWRHFKQNYESSSKTGKYTDAENVSRLFDALRGDARKATKTLLLRVIHPMEL